MQVAERATNSREKRGICWLFPAVPICNQRLEQKQQLRALLGRPKGQKGTCQEMPQNRGFAFALQPKNQKGRPQETYPQSASVMSGQLFASTFSSASQAARKPGHSESRLPSCGKYPEEAAETAGLGWVTHSIHIEWVPGCYAEVLLQHGTRFLITPYHARWRQDIISMQGIEIRRNFAGSSLAHLLPDPVEWPGRAITYPLQKEPPTPSAAHAWRTWHAIYKLAWSGLSGPSPNLQAACFPPECRAELHSPPLPFSGTKALPAVQTMHLRRAT